MLGLLDRSNNSLASVCSSFIFHFPNLPVSMCMQIMTLCEGDNLTPLKRMLQSHAANEMQRHE